MFTLIKAFWRMFTGFFGFKAERLQENRHVMSATYDKAITNAEGRFETVRNAVAELISIEQTLTNEVKTIGQNINRLNNIRVGAQAAMQKRLDQLRAEGKSKEDILNDPEFIRHKGAYDKNEEALRAAKATFDEKDAELNERKKQIATYKVELQNMQSAASRLRQEKQEALADVAIANQSQAINDTLAGIKSDTADDDLAAARAARNRAKSRSKVTAELVGADAKIAETEYLKEAQRAASTDELDKLLNWGDEPTAAEELAPAKLPEA